MLIKWDSFASPEDSFHYGTYSRGKKGGPPFHGHDFSEVFWIRNGTARHRCEAGEEKLARGHLVLIRPSDRHLLETLGSSPMTFVNLAFPARVWRHLGDRYFSDNRGIFWGTDPTPETHRLDESNLTRIEREADRLAEGPRTLVAIERFLLNLFQILRKPTETIFDPPEITPRWLREACLKIQRDRAFAGGVSALVTLSGRSPAHVSREMRRHLGMTPSAYIHRLRLSLAERQLAATNQSILEIALACGYDNLGHFYQVFRKVHQKTPRRYRLENQRQVM